MRKTSKLLLVGLTAALLLSLAVSSASANRLSISNRNIRAVWTPLRFIAGTNTWSCNFTLEGSFHSATIAKVANALIGFISRGSVGPCSAGSATILTATLPWHVQYESFAGRLPTITRVNLLLIGLSWQIQPSGSLVCLLRTEAGHPFRGEAELEPASGRITGLRAEPGRGIPLTGSGGFCAFAGEGHFEGTGVVTLLGNTTSVSIRLI
jgi:hypothetical protein